MEGLLIVVIIIVILFASQAYAAGKREGSRKGYGVGFDRGRRSKNQSGCLVFLMVGGLMAAASVAVACFQ